MKEKETGKMKNQNNTAQSAGKKSFLQKKNVEISFKRYAIDAMGAMALGLFASLLIGTIIKPSAMQRRCRARFCLIPMVSLSWA